MRNKINLVFLTFIEKRLALKQSGNLDNSLLAQYASALIVLVMRQHIRVICKWNVCSNFRNIHYFITKESSGPIIDPCESPQLLIR